MTRRATSLFARRLAIGTALTGGGGGGVAAPGVVAAAAGRGRARLAVAVAAPAGVRLPRPRAAGRHQDDRHGDEQHEAYRQRRDRQYGEQWVRPPAAAVPAMGRRPRREARVREVLRGERRRRRRRRGGRVRHPGPRGQTDRRVRSQSGRTRSRETARACTGEIREGNGRTDILLAGVGNLGTTSVESKLAESTVDTVAAVRLAQA